MNHQKSAKTKLSELCAVFLDSMCGRNTIKKRVGALSTLGYNKSLSDKVSFLLSSGFSDCFAKVSFCLTFWALEESLILFTGLNAWIPQIFQALASSVHAAWLSVTDVLQNFLTSDWDACLRWFSFKVIQMHTQMHTTWLRKLYDV